MCADRVDPAYEYIDKQVRSLKQRLGKLDGRIQNQENLALQDQIFRLNDKIKELDTKLLETNRALASSEILGLRDRLEEAIKGTPHAFWQKMHDFLGEESSAALQAVAGRPDPLAMLEIFRKSCDKYFSENEP